MDYFILLRKATRCFIHDTKAGVQTELLAFQAILR